MTEKEAYIAFNLTDNIGSVGVGRLAVASGGSVAAAWEAYDRKTAYDGTPVDVKAEIAQAKSKRITLVTPADEDYPKSLLAADGHPLCLYVRGDVKALSKPCVAIVGTRRPTSYGLDQAYRFGRDLAASGWTVVSGLALGIDAEVHRGALAAEGGVTVGVIGSALNCFYPEKNIDLAREIVAKGGAVVSEFPLGRQPDQKTFPQRNHVVAGLCRAVVAIEAPVKSGTLITTGIAADLGRTVFALSGRVDSKTSAGCLDLIRSGAILARCPADVDREFADLFKAMNIAVPSPKAAATKAKHRRALPLPPATSPDERLLLSNITAEGETLDNLVRLTGMNAARVNVAAMGLMMKDLARFLPGGRVALPREA